jgi:hypothetical protein
VGIHLLSTLYGSRTLVSLEDDQELFDEFTTLSHQVLFIKMEEEAICFSEFVPENVSLLVL